jgi:hypothetical protein
MRNALNVAAAAGGALVLAVTTAQTIAAAPHPATCKKIVMMGEVSAGQEWKTVFGEGWVFRVLPIDTAKTPPGQSSYSGWDLIVDREKPAGFPDALLLATPPYNSINEREVGTTFGVRAQDAIGWNPRSFRFLTNPNAFLDGQRLYHNMSLDNLPSPGTKSGVDPQNIGTTVTQTTHRLLDLAHQSSAGQFRILDAHLTPGISDATFFAENWAIQSARIPHTFEPAGGGKSTLMGTLNWIRFSVTLWLPGTWKAPAELHAVPALCLE